MSSRTSAEAYGPWLQRLQAALGQAGTEGADALRYVRQRGVHLDARGQSAGARWTLDRRIQIHPRYVECGEISKYALSLIVHEVHHLRQGPLKALSVYGELEAWKVQFRFLAGLDARPPGSAEQRDMIARILNLPGDWDRAGLAEARRLMRAYAGKAYRVDLLPLYPIDLELIYAITRRTPRID